MMNFISQFLTLIGIKGNAVVGDVIFECPNQPVDVAFVLKTIPCLEQLDKSAGKRLLNNIQAKHLIISFPIHSLGGRRDKGMATNYTKRFMEMVADKEWTVKSMEFSTELVFLVSK
jgi:16S rRNA (guanine(1405)-N(7))-methyltransferase